MERRDRITDRKIININPSTEIITEAILATPAKTVYVLPNNKNIILAAQQAQDLTDKKVVVIPSKSFPQGLAAVLAFDAEASFADNGENMTEAVQTVKSGEITHAVRDTHVNGFTINILSIIDWLF